MYLGDSEPVSPVSPVSSARKKNLGKVFFGQKRPMASWSASLHQLNEPWVLLKKVVGAASLGQAARILIRGPGYYTAGLRRRNALPEVQTDLNTLPRTFHSFKAPNYDTGPSL